MRRRQMFKNVLAGAFGYTAFWPEARAQGTSRVPKLKITAIKAVSLRGMNSKFVRVYTDQGLTGDGETLDTVGAHHIINENLGPALVGRDPLAIESIWFDLWGWKRPPGGIPRSLCAAWEARTWRP